MTLADAIRQEMDCVVHDAWEDVRNGQPGSWAQLGLVTELQLRLNQLIRLHDQESDSGRVADPSDQATHSLDQ